MLKNKILLIIGTFVIVIFLAGCGEKKQETHEGHDHSMQQTEEKQPSVHEKEEESITQKTCPVMGNPINKDLYVDHDGRRIYVCCGSCLEEVKKDPERYLKKLEGMGEVPESL